MVVLEAVNTLAQHGDVTVNAIASEVAVDQSGISGTLTEAAHAGLVDITSASGDRRHRTVSLTAAGRDVLADAHAWQESAFRQLTHGWDKTEREDFHRRLDQLIERSQTLTRASGHQVSPECTHQLCLGPHLPVSPVTSSAASASAVRAAFDRRH